MRGWITAKVVAQGMMMGIMDSSRTSTHLHAAVAAAAAAATTTHHTIMETGIIMGTQEGMGCVVAAASG